MTHREFKDPLYAEFARIGHAVASPKRLELLDLLSQGEKVRPRRQPARSHEHRDERFHRDRDGRSRHGDGTGDRTRYAPSRRGRDVVARRRQRGPNGIIAAAFGTRILATRTDGSSVGWDPIELPLEAEGLSWRPSGDRLAFDMGGAIHLADSTGRFARMFQRQQPFVNGEAWVAFLPNASTVLLNGGAKIWRIVLATGAADQLPSPASAVDLRASTSPDGTRAAFSRDGIVSIINLRTKAITSLQVFGTGVRWSPDGARIAYGDGSGLWVVHPDGSGAQSVAQPGIAYAAELDWSRDSKWIVVTTNAGLALVDPVKRTTLPLPSTLGGRYPAWRPIP